MYGSGEFINIVRINYLETKEQWKMSEKNERKQISNETILKFVLSKNSLKPSELAVVYCLAPSTI